MDGIGVRRDIDLGDELRKWRGRRKVSLRAMGKILHCDHSRVWKIENNRLPMTREVAELCDTALDTGGALAAALSNAREVIKPAQLPVAPARLVGRENELATLTAGARDRPHGTPAIVAIDGPAGVGKTALALRWAHDIARQYIDGHLYADLRAFAPYSSPDTVTVHGILEEFLTALGVSAVPATTEQRARLFRSLTANRRLLVVLDNAYSLEEIAPLLPASPGCGVVVTSRRTLAKLAGQLGATRVTLQPMTEPDAINLVRHLIGSARADTELAAMTTLTRLCGRLPLVLHAAAEQIAVYPHRRLSGLIDDLAEEPSKLSIGEATDLATVFSASYHDLDPGAARVFRLLGLHSGDHLSVAAIAALARISVPRARRLLHPLAAVHLVEIDNSDMVRMLAPVRAYARELVGTEDPDNERLAAAQSLVAWYIHTTRAAYQTITGQANAECGSIAGWLPPAEDVGAQGFPDRRGAIAWCVAEATNVSAVKTLAHEYGLSRAVHHLGAALANLGMMHGTSATFLDGTPVSEPGTERSAGPSGPDSAATATVAHDVSGVPSPQHGGMSHGPPKDVRVPPATLTQGTDIHAHGSPLRPHGGRHETRDQARGGQLDQDDDSDIAGCCGMREQNDGGPVVTGRRRPCACCRAMTSSSDLWSGDPVAVRRAGWDRRGDRGGPVKCCQRGTADPFARVAHLRRIENLAVDGLATAALRIPTPRS